MRNEINYICIVFDVMKNKQNLDWISQKGIFLCTALIYGTREKDSFVYLYLFRHTHTHYRTLFVNTTVTHSFISSEFYFSNMHNLLYDFAMEYPLHGQITITIVHLWAVKTFKMIRFQQITAFLPLSLMNFTLFFQSNRISFHFFIS